MKQPVYLFDFDGTLTRRDSLLQILLLRGPWWKLPLAALYVLPMMIASRMNLADAGHVKEHLLAFYLKGMSTSDFHALCDRFAIKCQKIWRPRAIEKLQQLRAEGMRCMVVTASIEDWVKPFVSQIFPEMEVVGTRMETRNGRLTGRFSTPNCNGEEKRRRLEEIFPPQSRDNYCLHAYGDSRGDNALMTFADRGEYRPFA